MSPAPTCRAAGPDQRGLLLLGLAHLLLGLGLGGRAGLQVGLADHCAEDRDFAVLADQRTQAVGDVHPRHSGVQLLVAVVPHVVILGDPLELGAVERQFAVLLDHQFVAQRGVEQVGVATTVGRVQFVVGLDHHAGLVGAARAAQLLARLGLVRLDRRADRLAVTRELRGCVDRDEHAVLLDDRDVAQAEERRVGVVHLECHWSVSLMGGVIAPVDRRRIKPDGTAFVTCHFCMAALHGTQGFGSRVGGGRNTRTRTRSKERAKKGQGGADSHTTREAGYVTGPIARLLDDWVPLLGIFYKALLTQVPSRATILSRWWWSHQSSGDSMGTNSATTGSDLQRRIDGQTQGIKWGQAPASPAFTPQTVSSTVWVLSH